MIDAILIKARHAKLTAEAQRLQLVSSGLRAKLDAAQADIKMLEGSIKECEFWLEQVGDTDKENPYPTLQPLETVEKS